MLATRDSSENTGTKGSPELREGQLSNPSGLGQRIFLKMQSSKYTLIISIDCIITGHGLQAVEMLSNTDNKLLDSFPFLKFLQLFKRFYTCMLSFKVL